MSEKYREAVINYTKCLNDNLYFRYMNNEKLSLLPTKEQLIQKECKSQYDYLKGFSDFSENIKFFTEKLHEVKDYK